MNLMGIEALYRRKKGTKTNPAHPVHPYLLRNLVIDRPNQVWAADISYIPMRHGFLYLFAVLDWATRRVLTWRLSNSLTTDFCIDAVEAAIAEHGTPEIFRLIITVDASTRIGTPLANAPANGWSFCVAARNTLCNMPSQQFKPPEYGTYINYQRVFCQRARDSDIEQFLSEIPLDHALRFFCGIGIMVSNFRGASFFDFQKGVVRELSAGNPYASRIIDMLGPQNTLITAEQMAVLQKFAIQYCKPEGSALPADFTDKLLRVMLAYNSLRGLEGIDLTDRKSAPLIVELRNTFSTRENVAFLIDLYWRYFKWAETDEARGNKHYLDANADFTRFYGLTYPEYAAAAFMFLSYYLSIHSVADLQRHNPFLDVDTFLNTITNQEPARKWLALNSMSMEEAKAQLEGPSVLRYSGLSLDSLQQRPFISVRPNVIFPPHLPFVENKMGTALFFAMLDGYNNADRNKTRSNRFTQFFADFFEQHCVQLAREAHPTPQFVLGEVQYTKEAKSTDLVIFEGENAVFIDIAAARLTMKQTLIDLDPDSISKDIRKIVDNAKQMTGAITAFRSGKLVYRDTDGNVIDPNGIKRIYPAALIIASVPRFFAFNKMIFDEIKAKGYLEGCEQFEVFSAEDFDLLMRLCRAGCLVSEVLARKLGQPIPWITMSSLKNYLAIYDHQLRDRAASVQWPGLGEVWYDELITMTRSWGLSA